MSQYINLLSYVCIWKVTLILLLALVSKANSWQLSKAKRTVWWGSRETHKLKKKTHCKHYHRDRGGGGAGAFRWFKNIYFILLNHIHYSQPKHLTLHVIKYIKVFPDKPNNFRQFVVCLPLISYPDLSRFGNVGDLGTRLLCC